jgi:hypothetical protein
VVGLSKERQQTAASNASQQRMTCNGLISDPAPATHRPLCTATPPRKSARTLPKNHGAQRIPTQPERGERGWGGVLTGRRNNAFPSFLHAFSSLNQRTADNSLIPRELQARFPLTINTSCAHQAYIIYFNWKTQSFQTVSRFLLCLKLRNPTIVGR